MSTTVTISKLKTMQWIMLWHTVTKRLEIFIDINIEIRQVDHYTWMFTSRTEGTLIREPRVAIF